MGSRHSDNSLFAVDEDILGHRSIEGYHRVGGHALKYQVKAHCLVNACIRPDNVGCIGCDSLVREPGQQVDGINSEIVHSSAAQRRGIKAVLGILFDVVADGGLHSDYLAYPALSDPLPHFKALGKESRPHSLHQEEASSGGEVEAL